MTYLYILIWIGTALELFIGTFILYVAIMKMREIQDEIFRIHWSVRWVCYLILLIGLILDVLLNWVVLTILFYELPKEFLSTARIVRHKYDSNGFRNIMALYFCRNWLTPFDERHCVK